MTVHHLIDCRDEKLIDINSWFSPEEASCGMTIYMDTVKIYLTSDQIDTIIREWKASAPDVKAKLCEHLLGHKEKSDATS